MLDEEFAKQLNEIVGIHSQMPEDLEKYQFLYHSWIFERDCEEERKDAAQYLKLLKKQMTFKMKDEYEFLYCSVSYSPEFGDEAGVLTIKLYVKEKNEN